MNVEYLVWIFTAASIVIFCKVFCRKNGITLEKFLGHKISHSDVLEISIFCVINFLVGIGSWSILVFLTANVDSDFSYAYWNLIDDQQFKDAQWSGSWLFVHSLAGIVAVPITEEIIFRGFILERLQKKHTVARALLISAALFAIFHINKNFLGSFIHGIIFGVLAIRFSSLYLPIFIHGFYNATVLIMQLKFGAFSVIDRLRLQDASYWSAEFAAFGISLIMLFAYWRKFMSLPGLDVEVPLPPPMPAKRPRPF